MAAKTGISEKYKALPEVGNVYNVNIEKVIAAQPDLVICYKDMNDKFVHNFEENNIPVIVLEMRTYAQVKNTVSVLGKITGNEAKAEELNKDMDERIAAVKAKMPQESKRIAILHSTAQNVTVQLEGSIAGSTAQLRALPISPQAACLGKQFYGGALQFGNTRCRQPRYYLHYQHGQAGNRAGRYAEKHQRKPGMAKPGGSAQRTCLLFAAGAVFVKPRHKIPAGGRIYG